jgi:hypothetical protein
MNLWYYKCQHQLANSCTSLLQLISEILDAHILYKKCVFSASKPTNDATARKNLLEEYIELNEAPGRPADDCLVSLPLTLKRYLE